MRTIEDIKKQWGLEERIEARKKEAKDKQIGKKASSIAQKLGHQESADRERDGFNRWIRQDSELIISHDRSDFSSSTRVKYKGELVFDEDDREIHSYIPGPWEALLDALCEQIAENQTKKAEADKTEGVSQREAALLELAKRFGL